MEDPVAVLPSVEPANNPLDDPTNSKPALTPPTSEDLDKRDERLSSELSELDSDEEFGEIEPDHYFEGGKIPVFKPTMEQFRDFKRFVDKVDKYGMKSGIVKVIPPKEWRQSLPDLSESVKSIKVKNPIMQEFAGQHGIYTQANIEKQRSYNLPEWKNLTLEPHHQPPAKRGERRKAAAEAAAPTRTRSTRAQASAPPADNSTPPPKRKPGRPRRRPIKVEKDDNADDEDAIEVPPTPKSPGKDEPEKEKRSSRTRVKKEEPEASTPTKPKGRQPRSTASRRMNNRNVLSDYIDEKAFENFDYHLAGLDEYSVERCKELEENYWRTINYGQPMYGADMPGSLFNDETTSWNVAKLPNLLDVLGTKVPGVNTAYLYLGMWKATFAWHLEDVDLYSINYIHFGAPKQWYSISQEDARRFEAAMKSIWPRDAKNCSQFLRHKTYLISPQQLERQFNIKVNRLVHYEGEFVITYPYGYHSGYNIGYNCAESVNFANESWLSYGRIAKKCECESDSVWVDVNEIERKLRGEPTPEYYEETDDEDDVPDHLPSPPPSVAGKAKGKPGRKPGNKRKRANEEPKEAPKAKKVRRIRIRIKVPGRGQPCCLCPNDVDYDELLQTDNGLQAHRLCADYTPETFITSKPNEKVCNVANIGKDRLDLKCNYCRSKRGAVFQCSQKKCTRAFHATCAAAAGVQVDLGPMPTFDEEGTEYFYDGYDFRCRFHRPKKRNAKKVTSDTLDNDKFIMNYARNLKPKDVVQFQYVDAELYQIYGGQVIENRPGEATVLVEVLPDGDRVEIEWKYLLALDPVDSERPKPSANAKPLPEHLKENDASLAITNRTDGVPQIGDAFQDPNLEQKWAEFHTAPEVTQKVAKVDLGKPNQLWHYLGKTSTEARPQYTEDLAKPKHNSKSNFLDTVKPPPAPVAYIARQSYPASYPMQYPLKAAPIAMPPRTPIQTRPGEKAYQYKPKGEPSYRPSTSYNYSPDTRKNPHSPVAHQPNVVYDHRASAPHYGYSGYPPAPQPQQYQQPVHFHQYIPPQASNNWKPSTSTQPPLQGIEQYARPGQPLPPYPFQQPPPSSNARPPPSYPYHQQYHQPPGNTPLGAPAPLPKDNRQVKTAATNAHAPTYPAGSAQNPIANGGFTPQWMPRPQSTNAPVADSSKGSIPGGAPAGPSTTRPPAQFQSADAFQRDMANAPATTNRYPRWEEMMKQLATSKVPTSQPASTPVATSALSTQPSLAPAPIISSSSAKAKQNPDQPPPGQGPSNQTQSLGVESHTPPKSPAAEPDKATPAEGGEQKIALGEAAQPAAPGSPNRPVYSPISDNGAPATDDAPALPAPSIHSGETWRYS
ncbi:hypothetical protein BU24DRAFT_422916 [Aaosphaeria arxii CBS 175.79]|uniref:[histone H3]-trimethyl-L-lysine(9) demethylase n=1 Tax=Aaosphaeria arxii CBS 175.79 TaxID=1450172 RepID=A0A6A5XUF7_9PLEO|nr:uncharacterized protein BU24DRAFT_422916 [Aaosphaeria arxii CBS 175.79]KAF2016556.1 hypothetical protein BU24DRAFT_422916 [Aaosphaeria arxii CBS 175.79]